MERWPIATATTNEGNDTSLNATEERHTAQHLRQGGRVSMSLRTKWIMAVTAALLGTSSASAQQQLGTANLASPQWEVPMPLSWGEKDEGFYFSAEATVMRINNALRNQTVARRGFIDRDGSIVGDPEGGTLDVFDTANPPNYITTLLANRGPAGAVYGSQEVALSTGDVNRDMFQPGTRLTLGYRLRNGMSVEASYLGITKSRTSATGGIIPRSGGTAQDNADSYLYSDFYNFTPYYAGPQREILSNVFLGTTPPGTAGAVFIAPTPADLATYGAFAVSAYGITNGFERVIISELLAAHTMELNLRVPVLQVEGTRTYWTGGLRYLSTTERFRMVIEDMGFPDQGATTIGNGTIQDNEVRNEWGLRYTNKQKNTFYGLQTGVGGEAYLMNGFAVSLDGKIGLLAQQSRTSVTLNRLDSAIGLQKRTNNEFTMAPMFQGGAYLWWYAHEGITFRAGYEYMGVLNAVRMTDPIDYDLGRLDPRSKKTLWSLDGFTLGVSFTF